MARRGRLRSIPHRQTIGRFFSFGCPREGGVPLGDGLATAVAAEGDLSSPLGWPVRGNPGEGGAVNGARLGGYAQAAAKELAADS